MHEEGEEVQKEEVEGEVHRTVPVVMFDVIALILEGVEYLVFYLPSAAPYPHQLLDVPLINDQIGHPAAVIGDLSPVLDPVFEEVDRDGFLVAIQRHAVYPLVDVSAVLILHLPSCDLFEHPLLIDPFHEHLMVVRLCDEDVIHVKGDCFFDGRLLAVQAVGDNDKRKFRMGLPYPREESFTRVDLAVLLLLAVGIPYLFRGKRDDLPHMGVHEGRLNDLMGIPDAPFLALFDEASRTGDILGGEILRAVDGGDITSQDLVLFEVLPSLQGTEKVIEERHDFFRIDLIDHLPHPGIFRDRYYVEQGLEVVHVPLVLHPPLKLKK